MNCESGDCLPCLLVSSVCVEFYDGGEAVSFVKPLTAPSICHQEQLCPAHLFPQEPLLMPGPRRSGEAGWKQVVALVNVGPFQSNGYLSQEFVGSYP